MTTYKEDCNTRILRSIRERRARRLILYKIFRSFVVGGFNWQHVHTLT